jgi:hypothetical protein
VAPSRPANEPLRLRGTPGQLTGFVPLPQQSEVPLPVDLEFANIAQPEVTLQETEGAARLTLSVAHTTPPGTYEGKVRVGDQEHPLILEVEPRVRLRVDPRRLHFEAAPGATREAELLVTNLGNVAREIRGVDAFGLFDTGGLDRAIGRAFAAEPPKGERRLDVIADAAAEGFGGLVRIKVESGAGELAPGESRNVHLTLALPEGIEQGRQYWGTWTLYNVNYVVRVDVTTAKPKRRAAR